MTKKETTMAWIKSYQELERHPKTMMLMNEMGWSLDVTIAKLHRLWWWCGDYAFDGVLDKHGAGTIALAVGLPQEDGVKFCDALVKSGFVEQEPCLRLHDWYMHFGEFLRSKFSKNPDVWKRVETSYRPVTALQPSSDQPPDKKERKIDKIASGAAFDAFWKAYPRKVGKGKALESWIKKSPPLDKCLRTLSLLVQTDQWRREEGRFIPHPATWLNQGRWDDVPEGYKEFTCCGCGYVGKVRSGYKGLAKCPECSVNTQVE